MSNGFDIFTSYTDSLRLTLRPTLRLTLHPGTLDGGIPNPQKDIFVPLVAKEVFGWDADLMRVPATTDLPPYYAAAMKRT